MSRFALQRNFLLSSRFNSGLVYECSAQQFKRIMFRALLQTVLDMTGSGKVLRKQVPTMSPLSCEIRNSPYPIFDLLHYLLMALSDRDRVLNGKL